jgi:hypothetical protein
MAYSLEKEREPYCNHIRAEILQRGSTTPSGAAVYIRKYKQKDFGAQIEFRLNINKLTNIVVNAEVYRK